MQEPTQRSFHELLQQLKKDKRHDMTVLLLGEAQPCHLLRAHSRQLGTSAAFDKGT